MFEATRDSEAGFDFFLPLSPDTKVTGRFGAFESDNFGLLLGILAFFVNASVRAKKQSAADTARRDGSSYPSCKVLPKQEVENTTKYNQYISIVFIVICHLKYKNCIPNLVIQDIAMILNTLCILFQTL